MVARRYEGKEFNAEAQRTQSSAEKANHQQIKRSIDGSHRRLTP